MQSYLARLDTAAAALPSDRRARLREEVEAHLTDALGDGSEATVAGILDELGPPQRLVAEMGGDAGHGHPASGDLAAPRRPRLEVVALTLLVVSVGCCLSVVLLPVAPLPWLVGSVLVLFSARWSAGDKALALVAFGILGVPFLVVSATGAGGLTWAGSCSGGSTPDGGTWERCTGGTPGWWWAVVLAVGLALLTLWVGTAVRLVRSMRRPEDHRRLLRMG